MAQQPANHAAAEPVVRREPVTAHSRDAALGDGGLVRWNFPAILRVSIAHGTDRAHAHPIKVRASLRRVTHKISMQGAILLRGGEFVLRQREVVHPDVNVSGAQKSLEACAKDLKFLPAFRQMSRK